MESGSALRKWQREMEKWRSGTEVMKSRSWKRLRGWMDENGLASGGEVSGKPVGNEMRNKGRKSKDLTHVNDSRTRKNARTHECTQAPMHASTHARTCIHASMHTQTYNFKNKAKKINRPVRGLRLSVCRFFFF